MKLWNTEIRRWGSNLPALLAAVLMLSGPGCASMQLLNLKTDKVPTADAEHPAIEVLAVWQAAEGPGIGGIPTRGFAGQIFFFTQDRGHPWPSMAKLASTSSTTTALPSNRREPLRQFDFDRQSWTAHLQSSKLGPTYGVFIPYPREDYHQAVCSLRIRLHTAQRSPAFFRFFNDHVPRTASPSADRGHTEFATGCPCKKAPGSVSEPTGVEDSAPRNGFAAVCHESANGRGARGNDEPGCDK